MLMMWFRGSCGKDSGTGYGTAVWRLKTQGTLHLEYSLKAFISFPLSFHDALMQGRKNLVQIEHHSLILIH